MDFTRLTQGEKIAGASGIALILIMFIFSWYGVELAGESVPDSGVNAWQAFGFIDIVLLVTVAGAIGLALISASQTEVGLPVAASAVVAGLGILSVILLLYRIIDTPGDVSAASALFNQDFDVTRKIGVWLGLIAAIGVTYGGWRAMQEEGTSFGEEADRFREPDEGPGAAPPPPSSSSPPPSSPPPGGTS
ncbi:MAG: hypothetical protein AABM66_01945 [Actinomycetota bacterium]